LRGSRSAFFAFNHEDLVAGPDLDEDEFLFVRVESRGLCVHEKPSVFREVGDVVKYVSLIFPLGVWYTTTHLVEVSEI